MGIDAPKILETQSLSPHLWSMYKEWYSSLVQKFRAKETCVRWCEINNRQIHNLLVRNLRFTTSYHCHIRTREKWKDVDSPLQFSFPIHIQTLGVNRRPLPFPVSLGSFLTLHPSLRSEGKSEKGEESVEGVETWVKRGTSDISGVGYEACTRSE